MLNRTHRPLLSVVALTSSLLVLAPGFVLQSDAASKSTRTKTNISRKSTSKTVKSGTAKNTKVRRVSRSPRYSASRSRARQARLRRALAAQRARELREAATPRFKYDVEGGGLVPDLRAAAAVVYNPTTQEIIWEEHGDDPRSIASITKVMTAVVLLEHETDPTRTVEIEREDVYRSNHTYLRAGERAQVQDLLHLMLIASDNAAARALARTSPFGAAGFIEQMNRKAAELGLTQTHYADPSGLLSENVSSALDMARLITYAAGDERIGSIMQKQEHQLTTSRRTFQVHTTNRLVGSDLDVRGGKTGFIRSSGYCLATLLRLPQTNEQVAVVVLGAKSNAGRFWETRHLVNWISAKAALFAAPAAQTPATTAEPVP